ncbi:MAG: CRISPR-associated endonuclease Cas9 [bacterium ADurb.Bin157]|nr:MAG: CRISPR-associated endonuclease Cas9 [bacterium ADurb.Bin157]
MALTLGLDIGSNSIGWALIDNEKHKLTDIGVRVFPEGVDRDTKGLEKSKNATRREARSARRTRQRRNSRKLKLIKELQTVGLLPKQETELNKLFLTNHNPYKLRKKGLDEKLEPFELGRILYHLSQRRGFKSSRKNGETKDDGKVKKEANELQKLMDSANCRTLGEYFAILDPDEQRIRGRYTFRSMHEKEFDLLWSKQTDYHNILTPELQKKLRDEIIFYQRPLKPSDDLIGNCELETSEKRCAKGDWFARKFRILQDVNNLKIQNPDGSENKPTEEQRNYILDELSKKKELKFDDIRKKLNLLETQVFNLEQDGKVASLKGDAFVAAMKRKNVFGHKTWDTMPEQEKIKINEAFIDLEDDDLVKFFKNKYKFNDEQIETALKAPLPQKYMSFSQKAILKLLPFMEQGYLTSEAIEKAGYNRNHENDIMTDVLPLPPDLRNPIVQKALFEVRKLINAVIRQYGKPKTIALEMARDVQGSSKQREEMHWKMLENEKRNKKVREKLINDMNITKPSRDDIIKYKLWEECGRKCPYTGKSISQNALFGEHPEFQIEHILPYDRSLDDSYMNKTLCDAHENIHIKKGQTPYEAYHNDTEKYEQIKQNIKILPYPKRQKFLQKEINLDEHIKRELNDTRYICRETINYLKQLGIYVRGTRGKTTAELRHQWGLDGIFDEIGSKRGDDHRRHAVDAAIVALTDNEHLRQLATSKYAVAGIYFDPPYPDFRKEIKENVQQINVSHRVQRKVSGKLHEETAYGPTNRKDEKGQNVFVYRKRLEDLTIPMVGKIVDHDVRDIVLNRLKEKGIDTNNGDRSISKEVWKETVYMKNTKSDKKVPIKKVRIEDVGNNLIPISDKNKKIYRYVAPGNNHHIEIFEYIDGKRRKKRDGKVITMFDAVQRSRNGEPVVCRDYKDGKKFICSLAINEMYLIETEDKSELYRVQKISSNKQIFLRHHTFGGDLSKSKGISKVPETLKGRKVTIDFLGRLYPAND